MTYNIKPSTKHLPLGAYRFIEHDGQLAVASEFNTRITYERANGRVDKWRTVRAFIRYDFHQRTRAIRHYVGISRLLRTGL